MNDLLNDLDFFLYNVYDFTSNKFICLEVNDQNTQIDLLNKTIENIKINSLIINIDLSDSEYIDVTNFNEIIYSVEKKIESIKKEAIVKTPNLNIKDINDVVCCFYFSSIVPYSKVNYLFSILNLAREFLFEKFTTTVFMYNTTYMNIFMDISDDLFSWVQCHFNFVEDINTIETNYILSSIAENSISENSLSKYETEFKNHINLKENAFILAYNYTLIGGKDIDRYLKVLQDFSIYDTSMKSKLYFILIFHTKDKSKIKIYIDHITKDENILDDLDMNHLLYYLDSNNLNDLITYYIKSFERINPKINHILYAKAFQKLSAHLYKEALDSFKEYFEKTIDKINNETIMSLYYIFDMNAQLSDYPAIIDYYHKYKNKISCIKLNNTYFSSTLLSKIGNAYYMQRNYKSSYKFYFKSIFLKNKIKYIGLDLIDDYNRMSDIAFMLKKKDKGNGFIDKSYSIAKALIANINKNKDDFRYLIILMIDISSLFIKLGKSKEFTILYPIIINNLDSKSISPAERYKFKLNLLSSKMQNDGIKIETKTQVILELLEDKKYFSTFQYIDYQNYLQLLLNIFIKYNVNNQSKELLHSLKLLESFMNKNKNYNYDEFIRAFKFLNIDPNKFKHSKKISKVLNHVLESRELNISKFFT